MWDSNSASPWSLAQGHGHSLCPEPRAGVVRSEAGGGAESRTASAPVRPDGGGGGGRDAGNSGGLRRARGGAGGARGEGARRVRAAGARVAAGAGAASSDVGKNGSRIVSVGSLRDSVTECLPLSQVVILGSWDRSRRRAPCLEPASPSAFPSKVQEDSFP
ncbi:unnamed protein product [Nyctereutes procyonoides]|uniref:(raccoon dog) hypothetical protein n=1 Tax=Nyctereutes procyonoides TaxID=34880 RepID=A0A811YCE4_NYCPR|nr:unnamed protein product [Nyctereutes procyonoides]